MEHVWLAFQLFSAALIVAAIIGAIITERRARRPRRFKPMPNSWMVGIHIANTTGLRRLDRVL